MAASADLIRRAREITNRSQANLAANAGVSQQAISAYETGKKEPTLPTLRKLIEASGLEMRIDLVPADEEAGNEPSRERQDEIAALRQRLADQSRIIWLRGR